MTILIESTEVYEEVAKTTAYIGGKAVDGNGGNLFDQVFVTEADREMLDGFFRDAVNNVAAALDHTLKDMTETDGDMAITLRLPGNFNTAMLKPLEQSVTEYVKNSVIAAWCAVVKKDEETYAAKAAALLQQINAMQYMRQRPKRNF